MRIFTDTEIDEAEKRVMDRLMWRLRSHIRSARLPRPNYIAITNPNPTIYLDYGIGDGKTRLRHLLAWCVSMPDLQLHCTLRARGYLNAYATGRLGTAPLMVTAGADLRDLGGWLENASGVVSGHVGPLMFTTDRVTTLDQVDLAAALSTYLDARAVAA